MASTRNINTTPNYNLQQGFFNNGEKYVLHPQKKFSNQDAFPCFGINVGHMPLKNLSYNGTDVESALFGIDSTNLVNPRAQVCNKPVSMPDISFFERNKVFLPEPLVMVDNQRPFPVPK